MLLHCFPRANRSKKVRQVVADDADDSSQAIHVGAKQQRQHHQQQQHQSRDSASSSNITINNSNISNKLPLQSQQQQQHPHHHQTMTSNNSANNFRNNPIIDTSTTMRPRETNPPRFSKLRSQPFDEIGQLLAAIEHDERILRDDLKKLATYLVLIGTDVTIATGHRQVRLLAHQSHLNLDEIKALIQKYQLTWSMGCELRPFDPRFNRTLYHIAHRYPGLFMETASGLSPGGYEERRFWWCANNWDFYQQQQQQQSNLDEGLSGRSSHLLSDVLCHFLELNDHKLIAINALHLSIKHSDAQVYLAWYEKNRSWLIDQIKRNEFGRRNPKLKKKLRAVYKLDEAERQLDTVHVDFFIEWWNLTGLRRPKVHKQRAVNLQNSLDNQMTN